MTKFMPEITIDQILKQHSLTKPDTVAYRFLEDGEDKETAITYRRLDRAANCIAQQLQMKKKGEIELALLLYPSGIEFIASFFGCLYADVIAVPMPIPKKPRSADRFGTILNDKNFAFILTNSATFKELQRLPLFGSLKDVAWIFTDQDVSPTSDSLSVDCLKTQPIAFLQYTSGSTGAPKGVMISHSNIISNERMIKDAFGHDEKTIFAGWLPLFHDMGLIGNILQPMYLGIPSILMSPLAFLQKPLRWLKAISKYQATTSGAPNFAYNLCVEKVDPEEMAALDLTSWKIAFNGSEHVHYKTLANFANHFSQCGFKKNSFYPCYGMAEATVFVSGPCSRDSVKSITIDKSLLETEQRAITSLESDYTLVAVGSAWQEGKILIVNPETRFTCSLCEVGEIWLQGPHIALGYWQEQESTKDTFQAQLADENLKQESYLRTGDLGFINENGDLFITGRLKDLIIIRGRNIYPQDIELLIEAGADAVPFAGCAAFSILHENEERLAVVIEIKRDQIHHMEPENLTAHIRRLISQEFQIIAAAIVFIKPGFLHKTSSGKVQRSRCKQLFLNCQLDGVLFSSTLNS